MDVWGALTLSGALVAMLVGLTEGQHLGWGSPAILGLFGSGVVLFVVWGLVELRVKDPMVDMRMLARRVVLFTNLTAMLSGFALYMTWVILPTFYQLPSGLPEPLADVADYGFGTSRDGRRPLDAADLALDPVRRAARGRHRAPLRRARAAGGRDDPRRHRVGRHRDVARRAVAAGALASSSAASASASPSP